MLFCVFEEQSYIDGGSDVVWTRIIINILVEVMKGGSDVVWTAAFQLQLVQNTLSTLIPCLVHSHSIKVH